MDRVTPTGNILNVPAPGTQAYVAYELGFMLGIRYADDPMRNMLVSPRQAAAWYAPRRTSD